MVEAVAVSQPALALRQVGVDLGPGAPLFHGVDLDVAPGEIVGIHGQNGVGKTTLLNIATLLLAPSQGTVSVQGRTVTERNRPAVGAVARSFQGVPATTQVTAWRYVEDLGALTDLCRRPFGLLSALLIHPFAALVSPRFEHRKSMCRRRVQDRLVDLGLDASVAGTDIDVLSLGTRRLLDSLRAIEIAGVVFVLDEPFANLRSEVATGLAERIRVAVAGGVAGLITDHDVRRLRGLADRLYELTPTGLVRC